ncbi:TPA: hypothetical protein O8U14_004499 [Enterobacter asburiae]|nr:hypothetical protein [Enterobacter asburiae]
MANDVTSGWKSADPVLPFSDFRREEDELLPNGHKKWKIVVIKELLRFDAFGKSLLYLCQLSPSMN